MRYYMWLGRQADNYQEELSPIEIERYLDDLNERVTFLERYLKLRYK